MMVALLIVTVIALGIGFVGGHRRGERFGVASTLKEINDPS
jgi:hypothetical protein